MTITEIENRIVNLEQEVKFLKEQLNQKKQSNEQDSPPTDTEENETAKMFDFLSSIII